jgi:hypothetical protein
MRLQFCCDIISGAAAPQIHPVRGWGIIDEARLVLCRASPSLPLPHAITTTCTALHSTRPAHGTAAPNPLIIPFLPSEASFIPLHQYTRTRLLAMAPSVTLRPSSDGGSSSGWSDAAAAEERPGWEVRPSGMVVQAREDGGGGPPPPPEIRVRVKYAAARHEVPVSPIATFGECFR